MKHCLKLLSIELFSFMISLSIFISGINYPRNILSLLRPGCILQYTNQVHPCELEAGLLVWLMNYLDRVNTQNLIGYLGEIMKLFVGNINTYNMDFICCYSHRISPTTVDILYWLYLLDFINPYHAEFLKWNNKPYIFDTVHYHI